jgi:hypothetical protein
MAVPTLSVPSFPPSDPQPNESRPIDRVIGGLLRNLDILGTAQVRVASDLESLPLTIEEVLEQSRRASRTSPAVADPSRKRE